MSRAYDDVFSHGLLEIEPALVLVVHVMRDTVFAPDGVALEVTPAGIPRVSVDPSLGSPIVLHWDFDDRSRLLPGEELVIEPALRPVSPRVQAELQEDLGLRIWGGILAPDAVELRCTRSRSSAVIDPRKLPDGIAWRVAWGYDLILATHTRIEDAEAAWVILESA